MNLKTLTYIVTIAEERNISRAAERLFVSQSTLSIFLKKLEKELGMPLFERTGRELRLTPAGEDYVSTAKKILDLREELFEKLSDMSGDRTLRIGIASGFLFSLFSSVLSEGGIPGLKVSIQEGRSLRLLHLLQKRELDTVIAALDEIPALDGLTAECLKEERMCVALPPEHPAAPFAGARYDDPPVLRDMSLLRGQKWALYPPDTFDYRIVSRMFQAYDLKAEVQYELYDTRSICRMVRAGTCLTALPEYTVPRDMGLLVCRPPEDFLRYQVLFRQSGYRLSEEEDRLMNRFLDRYRHYYEK